MALPAILGAIAAKVARDVALDALARSRSPSRAQIGKEVQERVAEAVKNDPEVMNEMNAERPVQSRVMWGGASAFFGAVGLILVQLSNHDFPSYDWEILGPALVTVWGGFYTLYGRFWPGLKPLFRRK